MAIFIKINHTHDFDYLFKIINTFSMTFLGLGASSSLDTDSFIIELIVFLSVSLSGYFILNKVTSFISTWLYVQLFLKTNINLYEAKKLTFLFNGSLGGKWYQLTEIKNLEKKMRHEFLLKFANNIAMQKGLPLPFP